MPIKFVLLFAFCILRYFRPGPMTTVKDKINLIDFRCAHPNFVCFNGCRGQHFKWYVLIKDNINTRACCSQLWVRHMMTCDGLYHFAFYLIILGYLWIPTDQVSPSQTLRCPGACDSRQKGHVVILDQSQRSLRKFSSFKLYANQHWYLPYPTYGSTRVVLWLLFCRSAPSTFPVTWSTLKGPFRGVPSC